MNIYDIINGTLELSAGGVILPSILNLAKIQDSRAISPVTASFFTFWSVYNLFFYTHLHQVISFIGAVIMAVANLIWLFLVLKYRKGPNG